jgi:hypothetical protein
MTVSIYGELTLAFGSKMESRLSQFHDLLRLAIISYLTDPAKSKDVYKNNLTGVITFVESFPSVEPYFRFRELPQHCRQPLKWLEQINGREGCASVGKSKEWKQLSIKVPYQSGGVSKDAMVPLYLLAPSDESRALPTYGLSRAELEDPTPPDFQFLGREVQMKLQTKYWTFEQDQPSLKPLLGVP